MSKRVAILISGSGSNMVSLANSMTGDHPARPCVVVSNVPGVAGLQKAKDLGIATACVDHKPFGKDRDGFEKALSEVLRDHAPDIICLAGFMRILTPGFVADWEGRMLNIHPSLLPLYKGLNTHARAIAAGDAEAGCTIHEVTAALDDGPILGQARVAVAPDDTPDTLAARILPWEHRLYPAVLERFAAGDRTPLFLP
ncbi:phosphoribosylglycinamide formyltransferase [Gymnodinialimonas ceratoperidinii]|uniref:Phosphoribosylglycinamide formyltransferase n=1 Tax=Gymnodinialimonas ceratoperidinii TaxID=2856823 RepID=A0A8F6YA91_9RHOB|nr:phosphoribosylglycinamide formyltransferase [Gymnodinialimonas ceratoperidinii]QXT38736.1 phosphoribosylglycinamide formyltransferase [Gymnodinialimonas ceratoperidinii]